MLDYLLDRALRAQGLVSLDSICHLDAPRKPAIRRLIEARVAAQELVPVALDGADKLEHWAQPEALEQRPRAGRRRWSTSSRRSIRWSSSASGCSCSSATSTASRPTCPRRKRVFGYFALPVLVGDAIVAAHRPQDRSRAAEAADAEMDLDRRRLAPDAQARIEEALHRFERFQLAPSTPGVLPGSESLEIGAPGETSNSRPSAPEASALSN